jgi:hypothetical protein
LVLAQVSSIKAQSMVHEEQGGRQRKIQVMSLMGRPENPGALDGAQVLLGWRVPAMTTGQILLLLGSGGLVGPSSQGRHRHLKLDAVRS